jgi:hypothetical protein
VTEALIYSERINALNGESGSGKSWVALHTCAETIQQGGHVLYIDLEDHPASICARLASLGCTATQIDDQFHYCRPDRPMSAQAIERIEQQIIDLQIVLIVIDSIGELLALQGCKPNDDDAVAKLYRAIPRRLANAGPAIILIDHVPKNNENAPLFAIGSQRKKAAIDGAAYMVETVKAFAVGTPGIMKLVTAKDRNGNFPTGSTAAQIDVTSEGNGERMVLEVKAPELTADGRIKQTTNISKICRYLGEQNSRRANTSQIQKKFGFHARDIGEILQQVVDSGLVSKTDLGQGKPTWYELITGFEG